MELFNSHFETMKKNGKNCVNISPCMKKLKPESTYMRTEFLSNSTELHSLCGVQRLGYCNMVYPVKVLFVFVVSHSVRTNCLQPHGLQPSRLLCPWNSPGKNTGVGCHFLLQGVFWPRDWTHISCVSSTAGWFSKSVNTEFDQWALKKGNKNTTLLEATHTHTHSHSITNLSKKLPRLIGCMQDGMDQLNSSMFSWSQHFFKISEVKADCVTNNSIPQNAIFPNTKCLSHV